MEVVESRKMSVVSIPRGFSGGTSNDTLPTRDGIGGGGSVAGGGGGGGSGCGGSSVGAVVVCRPPNSTNTFVSKMLSPPNGDGRNGFTVAHLRDGGSAVTGGGGMKMVEQNKQIFSNGTAAAVAGAPPVFNNNNNIIINNNNNNVVLMKPPRSAPPPTIPKTAIPTERKNNVSGSSNHIRNTTTTLTTTGPRNPPATPVPPQVKLTTTNTIVTPTSPASDLTTKPPTVTPNPKSPPHNTPPPSMDNKDNNDFDYDDDDDDASVCYEDNAGDDNGNNNISDRESTTEASGSMTTTSTTMTSTGTDTAGGGPIRNLRVRGQRKFLPEKTRHKRQTLQDMTRPLKQWLLRHRDNPYPSKAEKVDLVSKSQMTLTQVSNWFANARRRLKNTVKQPDLTWASRIKLYNSCVEGNAELFSICSDDSCPESDDDMMEHRQSDTFHDDVADSLTSSRTATPDVTTGSGNFSHGNSNGSHSQSSNTSNNSHHHHPSYHHPHSSNSNSSSSSVPSTGHSAPHYPGLEDSCVSFHKYKHSILHRYLSDAHQQALILDEDSVAKSRDRHHSSSTGSRDFEELSTSSVSSPAHESVHHDHLDDFSEEFETMALRRRTSDISSTAEEEDMYWKEIGAALALTSLARGRIVNT